MNAIFLDFLPETALDALLDYAMMRGPKRSFEDLQPCFCLGLQDRLDKEVDEAKAPERVHRFMVTLCVFSDPARSAQVLRAWFEPLGERAMAKWLDLTNRSSDAKRSYGHEILHAAVDSEQAPADPLMALLAEKCYLEQPRAERGPLWSALESIAGSDDGIHDPALQAVLLMLLQAEARSPGSCLTPQALETFASSPVTAEIIKLSVQAGLRLERWVVDPHKHLDLSERLKAAQASLDARQAAHESLRMLAASSNP